MPGPSPGPPRGFCDPLDGRAELRVHSLLPAHPRSGRTSAEGGPQGQELGAPAAEAEFIPGHPKLNRKLSVLHAALSWDDSAQAEIDAHLLAAAVAARGIDLGFPLETAVFSPQEAPQYANLPDLGPVLRSCFLSKKWDSNYVSHCLYNCLPVPRSASKPPQPDPYSCAILFNVLLATLLGLYPTCVKKPPFAVRSQLFARVHALLTSTSSIQEAFMEKNKPLVLFSLAEYCCRLIPSLFPAEREAICKAQSVDAFFQQGPSIFDHFRQDCVDSGDEEWGKLSAASQEAHDRLSRTYRSKCRLPQQPKRNQPAEISQEILTATLSAPQLVTYPMHRGSATALRDEYATLLGNPGLAEVATMHSLVKTAPLPESVRRLQVRREKACCLLCVSRKSICTI